MAVQTPEVEALKKPAPIPVDPRTLRHLNAIIANKDSMLEPYKREGYDKAWDQTFGTGKFRLSARGSDNMDFSEVDEHGYTFFDADHNTEAALYEQYHAEVMDDIQDTILELFEPVEDDWYVYESYPPQHYDFNPYTGGFDLSDPYTYEYVSLAEIEYDDDGQAVGINTENSCMRLGNHEDGTMTTGQALLNAKLAMEDPLDLTDEHTREAVAAATLNVEEGYLDYAGECVNPDSVRAKKVELAKLEMEQQALAADAVVPAPAEADAGPAAEPAPESSAVGPNAQGNDYAVAAQALTAPQPAPAPAPVAVEAEAAPEAPAPEVVAAAPVYKPVDPAAPGM